MREKPNLVTIKETSIGRGVISLNFSDISKLSNWELLPVHAG
jgi:hypothetical protein